MHDEADCVEGDVADGLGVDVAIGGCLANDDVEAATRVVSDSKAVGSDWPSAILSASLSGSTMRIRDYIIVVNKLNVVDARHLNFLLNTSSRNLV